MESAAFHINSLVEEEENAQRLVELQRCLYNQKPSIVKPGRKLIKEGIVMKMNESGGHGCARYLIVLSDIILYCKMTKAKSTDLNSLQCRCILPLHKCRITEIASKGIFTITCQNENLILYCEPSSASVVQEWIQVLQDAVKKCIENRKTLRKASSSRKPVRNRHLREYDENMIVATRQQLMQQRKRRYPTTLVSIILLLGVNLRADRLDIRTVARVVKISVLHILQVLIYQIPKNQGNTKYFELNFVCMNLTNPRRRTSLSRKNEGLQLTETFRKSVHGTVVQGV